MSAVSIILYSCWLAIPKRGMLSTGKHRDFSQAPTIVKC